MDSDEFDDIRQAVRRYVRDEVVPLESEIEDRDEIPERVRKTAAEMGLFGFALPEEYGGLGLSMEQEARLVFEDEGHGFTRYANEVRAYRLTCQWLESHLS